MKYTVNEKKVIYADLDPKEGVVLNLDTKNYYRLNETGQIIWQGLSAGHSSEEITASLTEAYDISAGEARADVASLMDQFRIERLVEVQETNPPAYDVEKARLSKKGK
jgi:hypothetical protein